MVPTPLFLMCMKKVYKANTIISINVVMKNKANMHISFAPLSNGSSSFTTDNQDVMNAIEHHCDFGKRFRLEKTIEDEELAIELSESATGDSEVEKKEKTLKRVKVTDIATAKDYLATYYGISRTVLRTEKSILEQAKACGVEFYGIDNAE